MTYDRSRYQDKWRLERQAAEIRAQLRLSQTDILDPWRFADLVPAHIFYPEDIAAPELATRVRHAAWDGFSFTFPDDNFLIVVLNSCRPRTRQCSSLLEELSHHLLGHKPSRIYADPSTGLLRREFDKSQEHEAFDFGSVLLLPKELIQQHVKEVRGTAAPLASACGCSVDLVHLRIKRCRLWRRYLVNCS